MCWVQNFWAKVSATYISLSNRPKQFMPRNYFPKILFAANLAASIGLNKPSFLHPETFDYAKFFFQGLCLRLQWAPQPPNLT